MRFALASAILVVAAATSASAADHQVTVGSGGLVYNPTSVTADPNDTVTFTFSSRDHTVTQSNFTAPCLALEGGIDSGFPSTDTFSFTITVNDTSPTWWYCRETRHCQGGMVFAINPTTNDTFEKFQATAVASASNGSPPSSSSSLSSTTRSSPSSTTSTTSSTTSNSAMSAGAQVGGLLAAVGFVAGILL